MDKVFINIQVPRDFRDAIKAKADEDGHTMSLVVRALLVGWLDGEFDPWAKKAKTEKEVEFLEEEEGDNKW